METIFSTIYFQYTDYLLFIIGFIFISFGILILIFSKQRKLWMSEGHLLFYSIYILIIGIAVWSDLFLLVYTHHFLFEEVHLFLYVIAYLIVYEFGRRMLFKKNIIVAVSLYIIPVVLFLLDIPTTFLREYFAMIGSFMAGLGFYKWSKKQKELYNKKIYLNWILPITFILLFLGYSLYFLYDLFDFLLINANHHNDIYYIKHYYEWSLNIILSLVVLFNIISEDIQELIEMQLKSIKIRFVRSILIIIVILAIIGFFLVHSLGEWKWEEEKNELLNLVHVVALYIDGDTLQKLNNRSLDEQRIAYTTIRKQLQVIGKHMPNVSNIYTMFIRDSELAIGVKADTGYKKSDYFLGSKILNPPPGMRVAFDQGKAMMEEYIKENQSGVWLEVFVPIKNQDGEKVGILSLDVSAQHILESIILARFNGLIFLLVFFLISIGFGNVLFYSRREVAWQSINTRILSSVGDIVGVFNQKGKMIYANDAAATLTGYSSKVIEKYMDIYDFISVNDRDNLKELLRNMKEDQIYYSELSIGTVDGVQMPVYIRLSYLDFDHNHNDPLYIFTAMNISERKKREEELLEHFQNTVSLLATVVDAKDGYTARHSINVAYYAKAIAKKLNFSDEKIKEVETAALVHDIGKMGISDHILKKEGPLTDEEWMEMKRHPEYGKQILEKAGNTFEYLIPYVFHHHERFDGKGYPTAIKEPPIPICIISVADAFDAMTSDRSYRKEMSIEKAKMELINNSGKQFHPEVVNALIKILDQEINIQ